MCDEKAKIFFRFFCSTFCSAEGNPVGVLVAGGHKYFFIFCFSVNTNGYEIYVFHETKIIKIFNGLL